MILVGLGKIGAGLAVALLAAYMVLFTFRRFGGIGDVQEAMRKRDPASPLVHAAGFVAVGLIVRQSLESAFMALDLLLRGDGSPAGAAGNFLIYAAMHVGIGLIGGVLVITVGMWLFNAMTARVDEVAEIRDGNVAAAVLLAGVLLVVAGFTAPGLKTLLDGLLPWPDLPNTVFPG
jgi:hypothetical protein